MSYKDRTFGLEIELGIGWNEGRWEAFFSSACSQILKLQGYIDTAHQHGVVKGYDVHLTYDGSVHGVAGRLGYELITKPITLSNKELIQKFTRLLLYLHKQGGFANSTCGLHTHIGGEDFTSLNLKNLLKFYVVWQPALFSILPVSRRNNRYCRLFSPKFKAELDTKLALIDDSSKDAYDKIMYKIWYDATDNEGGTRYKYLNLKYLDLTGHYEVRASQGLTNPERIWRWVELNTRIAEFCKAQTKIATYGRRNTSNIVHLLRCIDALSLKNYFLSELARWS